MRAPRCILPLVALSAVFAAGCGSESEEDKIRQVYDEYLEAVVAGDSPTICSEILPPSQVPNPEDCEAAWDGALADAEVGDTSLGEITIDGESAIAEDDATGGFIALSGNRGTGTSSSD